MKSTTLSRKTALLALLLAAALFLSGCNLIVKDPEVDARQVILSINGEDVTKADFTRYYNNAYDRAYEQQMMMQQYGYPAQPIDTNQLMLDTMDNTAKDIMLHQKAHELGLDELTEEESKALEEKAKADYQNVLSQVKEYYFANTTLEGEELDRAIEKQAQDLGLNEEIYLESAKEGSLHEKLHDYAGRDITITEEELQTALETKVEEDKARFETDLAAYGTALTSGQPVYYTPAGYRYVRQILVSLTQEDKDIIAALNAELSPLTAAVTAAQAEVDRFESLLSQESVSVSDKAFLDTQKDALADEKARYEELLASEGLSAEEQTELDALKAKTPVYAALEEAKAAVAAKQAEVTKAEDTAFANIQLKTDEVMAKATAEGADFDALVAEYSEDPGQPALGYAVSDATTQFVQSFKDAAMGLANVGDISQPARSTFGNHILKYTQDLAEGPATLDSVRDTLQDELFHTRLDAVYAEMEAAWLAEADIKKYPERMKN